LIGESAGLLMFRRRRGRLEFLLGHPGGPFWKARDAGAWTIPKGGIATSESALDTAIREFREETGCEPQGPYLPLGTITQRAGKIVHAWAFEGDLDPAAAVSITTTLEWPPRSGRYIEIPEIDRVAFFEYDEAATLINAAQVTLLDRLCAVAK
jgi:predicted NUDIX family NTP pyrophosphohydrolase